LIKIGWSYGTALDRKEGKVLGNLAAGKGISALNVLGLNSDVNIVRAAWEIYSTWNMITKSAFP
jgi:hypothetical protein